MTDFIKHGIFTFPSDPLVTTTFLLQPRSALVGSAGPPPMVWPLEDAPLEHSAGPGCLTEAPGMAAHPGIAWPHQNWPPEPPVTMQPR